MNYEYNEGSVLLEKKFKLNYPMSYEGFRTKISTKGVDLLVKTIFLLVSSKRAKADSWNQIVGAPLRPMESDMFDSVKEGYFQLILPVKKS